MKLIFGNSIFLIDYSYVFLAITYTFNQCVGGYSPLSSIQCSYMNQNLTKESMTSFLRLLQGLSCSDRTGSDHGQVQVRSGVMNGARGDSRGPFMLLICPVHRNLAGLSRRAALSSEWTLVIRLITIVTHSRGGMRSRRRWRHSLVTHRA